MHLIYVTGRLLFLKRFLSLFSIRMLITGAHGLVGYDTALTRQGSGVQVPVGVEVFCQNPITV